MKRIIKKTICCLLVLVLICPIFQKAAFAQTPQKEYISVDKLNYEKVLEQRDDHIQFQLKTEYMREDKLVYDCYVDKANKQVKMTILGYMNGEIEFSEDFIIPIKELHTTKKAVTIDNIEADDIINALKSVYKSNSDRFKENASTKQIDSDNSIKEILQNNAVDNNVSDDLVRMSSGAIVLGGLSQLTTAQMIGAAFLTFLSANWAVIVVLIIIAAIAVSAYILYDHLKTQQTATYQEYTESVAYHVDLATIKSIQKKRDIFALYYSPEQHRQLYVYNIDVGTRGSVNKLMIKHTPTGGTYDEPSFNLTGFKLLVLVDLNSRKIHHAEVRYGVRALQQIEYFRYKNKLTIQQLPTYSIDNKYSNGSANGAGDNQLAK